MLPAWSSRADGGSRMNTLTVGMADLRVTADADSMLVTYALGSCIAVMVHDPIRHVGGLLHYMLPQSTLCPEKAGANPAMFADTGVPLLFEQMYRHACKKADLIVKIAGGANVCDDHGTFEIGRRNYLILRKIFWKAGVTIAAEDVGGASSRTTRLFVGSGRATVRIQGEEKPL